MGVRVFAEYVIPLLKLRLQMRVNGIIARIHRYPGTAGEINRLDGVPVLTGGKRGAILQSHIGGIVHTRLQIFPGILLAAFLGKGGVHGENTALTHGQSIQCIRVGSAHNHALTPTGGYFMSHQRLIHHKLAALHLQAVQPGAAHLLHGTITHLDNVERALANGTVMVLGCALLVFRVATVVHSHLEITIAQHTLILTASGTSKLQRSGIVAAHIQHTGAATLSEDGTGNAVELADFTTAHHVQSQHRTQCTILHRQVHCGVCPVGSII